MNQYYITSIRQNLVQFYQINHQIINLPSNEISTLKQLRQNQDIIILPAEKGNVTVVMNNRDHDGKLKDILTDESYK